MLKIGLYITFLTVCFFGHAQSDSTRAFKLGLEFRPRFEFRDGYRSLPPTATDAAFFVSTRSRLLLDFKTKKAHFHASIQDVRVWGQNGSSPATNGLSLFEAYATFNLGKNNAWSLKAGRQAVELDNGRLFSKANWSQFSRAHDGLRLNYSASKLSTDLMLFYNQVGAFSFGTFYPLNHYKYLANHYLKYALSDRFTLNVLNSFDGYQSQVSTSTVYVRGTSGGRLTYKKKAFKATIAAYYQYGQLQSGQRVSAFYLQPEVSFKIKRLEIRAGMEYLSGEDNTVSGDVNRSFSTLYGVAFKFNGHLNYFTSFPADVNGAGLINPYLFFDYKISKKLRLKFESHLFYSQSDLLDIDNNIANPYLGFETDLKLKYEMNADMDFDLGISTMIPTASMSTLKTGDYLQKPLFLFLMFTWKPTLFEVEQKIK